MSEDEILNLRETPAVVAERQEEFISDLRLFAWRKIAYERYPLLKSELVDNITEKETPEGGNITDLEKNHLGFIDFVITSAEKHFSNITVERRESLIIGMCAKNLCYVPAVEVVFGCAVSHLKKDAPDVEIFIAPARYAGSIDRIQYQGDGKEVPTDMESSLFAARVHRGEDVKGIGNLKRQLEEMRARDDVPEETAKEPEALDDIAKKSEDAEFDIRFLNFRIQLEASSGARR